MTQSTALVIQQVDDPQAPKELLATYNNFSSITAGDFVMYEQTSNGQGVTSLVAGILESGESSIVIAAGAQQPCALEVEASASQRVRHQFATIGLFDNGPDGLADDAPAPINIVNIHQSNADNGAAYSAVAGTIVTMLLETPLPAMFRLSDWVHVDGLVDNRLSYSNLCVKYISYDRKTITAGFSDESALPSLAVPVITPPLGSAKLYFYNNAAGARNSAVLRFTGTSATSAAIATMFADGDVSISGALLGSHLATVGSSATQYLNAGNGQYELKANTRWRIECTPKDTTFLDRSVDSATVWNTRVTRTAVKPENQARLKPRFRLYRPQPMSRPVAKIISAVKTGTTTATLTLDRDISSVLATGKYCTVKGVRDVTNFAALTTPTAITVVNPTTVQIVFGTAVTATSYGGSLILANGGVDQPGVIGQTVQNVVWDAVAQTLTLVGNTNWSGMSVADVMELHGVRSNVDGSDLGVDGPWRVANISTTTLVLQPIVDILGVQRSPTLTTLASTPCGGTVVQRTVLRAYDLMFESWDEHRMKIEGAGTSRQDLAIPVRMVANDAGGTVQGVQGNKAVDAPIGDPVLIGGRASNANITAMSNTGDMVAWLMTMIGAGIVKPYSLPESDWTNSVVLTTTADTALQTAAGAGIKRYLVGLQVQNTNATATTLIIKDGTTAKWTISLPASMTLPLDVTFTIPIFTTANAALNVACGTTGANVLVNAQGYTAP